MKWMFFIIGGRGRKRYGPYCALASQTHGNTVRLVAHKPDGSTTTFGKNYDSFRVEAKKSR